MSHIAVLVSGVGGKNAEGSVSAVGECRKGVQDCRTGCGTIIKEDVCSLMNVKGLRNCLVGSLASYFATWNIPSGPDESAGHNFASLVANIFADTVLVFVASASVVVVRKVVTGQMDPAQEEMK
ncbi:hypothetical protein LX32DRAFT_154962 [Colletotrichum zoysiae]|uniref:Uncharacterized protein n=1 Tax=Colletotrichum zoysiae TaxID=1216348 RepID=A0AAD9HVW2_9PEZI|nr:hypothetical protein LX32DRAFT_154962 [Colletotrichum zoysiae]